MADHGGQLILRSNQIFEVDARGSIFYNDHDPDNWIGCRIAFLRIECSPSAMQIEILRIVAGNQLAMITSIWYPARSKAESCADIFATVTLGLDPMRLNFPPPER